MAESQEPTSPKSGSGCFSKLLGLVLISGLATAVYFISQAQDLSDLQTKNSSPPDLKVALKEAIRNDAPLTLSEGEINRWLAQTLVAKQGGLLAEKISLDRVCVRLQNQRAEIIMLRHCFGYPFTISMYLTIERSLDDTGPITTIRPTGGPYLADYPYPPIGGRFGKLVVPQGFLHLILPSYERLAAQFSEEINLAVVKMWRVRIEPQKLILDPREPLGNRGMPQTF
jgi:hypothetical protein